MLFRMLKKDLFKRKGINLILFLFITLATVFLASSANNIFVVGNGLNHYMEYANVPDINIVTSSDSEKDKIKNWLNKQVDKGTVSTYDYNNFIMVMDKDIKMKRDGKVRTLNSTGASLYISKQDSDFNLVYDDSGNEFSLKKGEVGLSVAMMKQNHLEIGDQIYLNVNNQAQAFTIREKVKDAAFGSEMMGMARFIVSDADYDLLEPENSKLGLYYVMTDQVSNLTKSIDNQAFRTVSTTVTVDMYQLAYSFDMILSALLILIGICLILIALLVLRFTLVFTMEEEYSEIGILKAIGFRNFSIKRIYLLKYLFIVLLGSTLGMILSVSVSGVMIDSVSKNMILASTQFNFLINLLSALFVIVFVICFCYICTRKLNHVSAVSAIRDGQTGERFQKRSGISLSRRSMLPVCVYLGVNDILNHIKRYIVLIVTFAISFVLITIPLNTLNTISSDEMLMKFRLNPESLITVRSIEQKGEGKYTNVQALKLGMERLKTELTEKGYKDVKVTGLPTYFIKYFGEETSRKNNIMSIQILGDETKYAQYEVGKEPVLANEVAFSEKLLEENSWKIGDQVEAVINGKDEKLLISGAYSDYMQLGKSAQLNPELLLDEEIMFDYWTIMIDMDTSMNTSQALMKLKKQFPDYEWRTSQELVDQNVGGIQNRLEQMLFPMTLMLCAVIMLITLLMGKLFIVREKGEMAMLKSIGFRVRSIRCWQIVRMVLVALSSMIVAIPISLLSNQLMLKPIFALMGANVTIQVDILRVYFIYPGMLLLGIIIATIVATRDIKKIDIKECNNLE